jgi:hypothetical protein
MKKQDRQIPGAIDIDEVLWLQDSYKDTFSLEYKDGKVFLELGDNINGDPLTDLALDHTTLVSLHSYLNQILQQVEA